MATTMARIYADRLDTGAMKQIADYCQAIATRKYATCNLTDSEVEAFATLEAAIHRVLEMQTERK